MADKEINRQIRLAYQRGYARATTWPDHIPPYPPEPVIAELMAALNECRDTMARELAMPAPDDEREAMLGPAIDYADEALAAVGLWIKDRISQVISDMQTELDCALKEITSLQTERRLLAKLAADGPAFYHPPTIHAAKQLRNQILRDECKLNPDGTPIEEPQ